MKKITKLSLEQLAQQIRVFEKQEQKIYVGGATAIFPAENLLEEYKCLGLATLGKDSLLTQIGRSEESFGEIFPKNLYKEPYTEEDLLFANSIIETIFNTEDMGDNSGYIDSGCIGSGYIGSGTGIYVGKEDGMDLYLLKDAVVVGRKPSNPFNPWYGATDYSDTNDKPSLYPKGSIGNPYTYSEYQSLQEKTGYYYNEQGILSHTTINTNEINKDQRFHMAVINSFNLLDAMSHYVAGNGKTINLSASIIDFSQITKDDLHAHKEEGIYSVNLLTWRNFSQNPQAALILGKITLQHIGGERYRILDDLYDFDQQTPRNFTGGVRNALTLAGSIIHELFAAAGNVPDNAVNGHLNPSRPLLETTAYKITFTGEVYIKDK